MIVGARGTLGEALVRACIARALPHRCLGRESLDIADRRSVRTVLAERKPWAVINAAGCVDVDLAERDSTRCWRDNRDGPEILAKLCAEHGIALVTFSRDLVVDGGKDLPYLKGDRVAPLNVYGQSKAAAERSVLARHPQSLGIRTSAFFGPWDRYNFAVRTLASLRAGYPWPRSRACSVSPTYLPDLVYHALDLLIDGESGIWHLANRGSTTWFDFAREIIAAAWGMDRAPLVQAVSPAEAGCVAPRSVNSALASERGDLDARFDGALGRFVEDAAHHWLCAEGAARLHLMDRSGRRIKRSGVRQLASELVLADGISLGKGRCNTSVNFTWIAGVEVTAGDTRSADSHVAGWPK